MGTQEPVTPEGYIEIYCQLNANTKKIKGNQRFLIGPPENRVAIKVYAWGVKNYLNQKTTDDTSGAILQLVAGGNYVNPDTDDIINGIANAYLDYGDFTSGSNVGTYSILVDPPINYLYENTSGSYTVNYYSGSTIHAGSFVFTVDSSTTVPGSGSYYEFNVLGANSFEIFNVQKYFEDTLNILASGSSGSRIFGFELRGAF
jgi:hypothetical protein